MYDTHVHSKFSTDSELDMEAGIIRAIELGLTGITFTDHLDVDFVDHEDEYQYDFNEYFTKLNTLRDRYYGKIEILSGVELGIQPHVIDETKKRIEGFEFDYVIGSTHLIHRRDPYYGTYFIDGISKIASYDEYLTELFDNLKLYHNYCTMGHIDYIVRYAHFNDSRFLYKEHADILDEIFRFIISHSIALEINTSTYLRQPLDTDLIKRYKELGGELITIGSDAHSVDRIGCNFDIYSGIIKECGLPYLFHYKDMKPLAVKI